MEKILVLLLCVCVPGTSAVIACLFNTCEQKCVNQLIGYKCYCNPGWSVDPNNSHKCIAVPVTCNAGYEPNPSNVRECRDIDECSRFSPCAHQCYNTNGGYRCSCNPGFHVSPTDSTRCEVDRPACSEGYRPGPSGGCVDIDECAVSSPCAHNCVNYAGGYRCSCRIGYEVSASNPNLCSQIKVCVAPVDIILVLDSSGSMGDANNALQLAFASKIVDHFQVGNSKARFGALLFSDMVEKLFDLNTYKNNAEVTSAISRAPFHKGTTHTHKALDYIRQNQMFANPSGGRANAPNTAIVLTDGQSNFPEQTVIAADNLKREGVHIIAVGIGQEVSTTELYNIASSNSDVFAAPSFEMLDYIEQQLNRRACPDTK